MPKKQQNQQTEQKTITDIKGSGLFAVADEVEVGSAQADYLNQRYGSAVLELTGGEVFADSKVRGKVNTVVQLRVIEVEDTTRHPEDTYEEQRAFRRGEDLALFASLQSQWDRDIKKLKRCLAAAFGGHPRQIDGKALEALFHDGGKAMVGKRVFVRMEPRVTDDGRVYYNPSFSRADLDDAQEDLAASAFG